MVQAWYNFTPTSFIFAPKIPKRITHDEHLENVGSYLDYFLKTASLLGDKLGPLLVQLPPSFKHPRHEEALEAFVGDLTQEYRFALEFRHKSWFNPKVDKLLQSKNICQVWSVNQYLTTPPTVTSDFVYLRFVGDRELTQFKSIQKDQADVMKTWKKVLQDVGESVKERFVFFNNHFAGFGPASANEFRRLMGLIELDWSGLKEGEVSQKTLFDFSNSH